MKHWLFSLLIAPTLVACDAIPTIQTSDTPIKDAGPSFAQKHFPVTITKIADGVWVHTSNYRLPGRAPVPSNGMIIEDGEELIVIDTAWGEMATEALVQTVKESIDKPITKVILTHYHPDRLGGIDVLEAYGAESFTHPQTPVLAAQNWFPVPNRSVAALNDPKSRVKVGPVEIAYPGPAHAPDNLVVYIPNEDILFGSGAIKSAGSQSLGNIESADLKAWPETLAWVKATYPNTKLIVPGHGKGADITLIDNTMGLVAKAVNAQAKSDSELGEVFEQPEAP